MCSYKIIICIVFSVRRRYILFLLLVHGVICVDIQWRVEDLDRRPRACLTAAQNIRSDSTSAATARGSIFPVGGHPQRA